MSWLNTKNRPSNDGGKAMEKEIRLAAAGASLQATLQAPHRLAIVWELAISLRSQEPLRRLQRWRKIGFAII
ncbi:MAG: hypothetical protein ACKO28_07285 [Cyanobium sp.]